MLQRIYLVLLMLLSTPVWARTPVPPLMATLGGETPIRLQSVAVRSVVAGDMAETTVRMEFFNPNARVLAGELQFPLAQGQQFTGFALDVEGALRPAVPVEKARGRQILETEMRRNVDPGLLEQTVGNNFKLRVYPIPAGGVRTVELKYAQVLQREGGKWIYRQPVQFDGVVSELDVQVSGAQGAPQASGVAGLRLEGAGGSYAGHAAQAHGTLVLALPASDAVAASFVQEFNGQRYFMAEVPVSAARSARSLPRVVGLLWDASGSGAARNVDAELQVLDRYFRAAGNVEVRLVRLRDHAEAVESFRVAGGDWSALRRALLATPFDGATALADWQPQRDVGEYLLFSDGLSNYGSQRFPALAAGRRLYALDSSTSSDPARLAALAQRSGGQYITIDAGNPARAAELLLADGVMVSGMEATGVAELVADSSAPGLLRFAGRLTAPSAQLSMTVVEGGKPRKLELPVAADAPAHPLAAWWWANRRVAALEGDFELQRAAIRRLGLAFGMPTRETSLIVLERVEDYVRHDIAPPPTLRAAFDKLRAMRLAETNGGRKKQLDDVVRRFNEKVVWWQQSYPKGDKPVPVRVKDKSLLPVEIQEGRVMAAPSPAPVVSMREEARERTAAPPPPPSATAPAPSAKMAPPMRGIASDMASAEPAQAKPSMAPQPVNGGASISLKAWVPNAPYIQRMRDAAPEDMYRVYLDERPSYANSTAFFLDVASLLLQRGQRDLGLRVLSNLAEMELENRHVLRVLGYRLMEADAPVLAVPVFEQVLRLADEEPQSFRDLGLALAASGQGQRAVEQLYQVVLRPWDARFADIELIALAELNSVVEQARAKGKPLDTGGIDSRLLRNLPLDLRVALGWDADNSDMDLWVIDPNGEACYFGHRSTYQGGLMSRDFTGGYGPEEFSLRFAKPGVYRIEANFFGSRQQVVTGATTLQLRLSTGFGTAAQKDKMTTIRLAGRGERVVIGEFEVKPR